MTEETYPSGFSEPSMNLFVQSGSEEENDTLRMRDENIRARTNLMSTLFKELQAVKKPVSKSKKRSKVVKPTNNETPSRRSTRHLKKNDSHQSPLTQSPRQLEQPKLSTYHVHDHFSKSLVGDYESTSDQEDHTARDSCPNNTTTKKIISPIQKISSRPMNLKNLNSSTNQDHTNTSSVSVVSFSYDSNSDKENQDTRNSFNNETIRFNNPLHNIFSRSSNSNKAQIPSPSPLSARQDYFNFDQREVIGETSPNNSITSQRTIRLNIPVQHQQRNLSLSDSDSHSSENEQGPRVKKRRRAQKKTRFMGKIITSVNAMPELTLPLQRELDSQIINRVALNSAVKDHILKETGDLYPTRTEWNFICSALIKRFPILADADDPESYSDLKYRLRNSITSKRSYKQNGVPSRAAGRTAETPTVNCPPSSSNDHIIAEYRGELMFQLRDEERLKFLIRETLEERLPDTPDQKLDDCPHYKNGEMLIYEYSLVIKRDLNFINDNAETFTRTVATGAVNLQDQLKVFKRLQKELLPKRLQKKKLKPAWICKDAIEAHGDVDALSTGHAEQAPFLITVVDTNQHGQRVLTKALLIYKQGVISQLDRPTLPQSLIFLLGAYFVLNLEFPLAYDSFLRLLEKQIHGALNENTAKKRAKKEYFNYMKTKFGVN